MLQAVARHTWKQKWKRQGFLEALNGLRWHGLGAEEARVR